MEVVECLFFFFSTLAFIFEFHYIILTTLCEIHYIPQGYIIMKLPISCLGLIKFA